MGTPHIMEPSRKRVRFNSDADPRPELRNDPKKSTLPAKQVVELRFISSPDELPDPAAASDHPAHLTAHPTYLHQVIPDEQVHGWHHLTVAVYVHKSSLASWIDHDGQLQPDNEQNEVKVTDLPQLITPFIKNGLHTSRSHFLTTLSSPHVMPLSTAISKYQAKGMNFAIYKEKFFSKDETGSLVKRTDLLNYHHRMAFLMFTHIDGASFIDHDDPRWEVFVVAELIDEKPTNFVGYATTYPFSALSSDGDKRISFSERIRVSQVFISPLAQAAGHGRRLLTAVYDDALARKAMEVTVEDPSIGFRLLRDVTDLRRCYQHSLLDEDKAVDYDKESQLVQLLKDHLLLTSAQAKRCLEVHQLRHVDKADEKAYRRYRLWVKRRLYKENVEVLDQYEAQEKKDKLAEIYEDYEKEYSQSTQRIHARVPHSEAPSSEQAERSPE